MVVLFKDYDRVFFLLYWHLVRDKRHPARLVAIWTSLNLLLAGKDLNGGSAAFRESSGSNRCFHIFMLPNIAMIVPL